MFRQYTHVTIQIEKVNNKEYVRWKINPGIDSYNNSGNTMQIPHDHLKSKLYIYTRYIYFKQFVEFSLACKTTVYCENKPISRYLTPVFSIICNKSTKEPIFCSPRIQY